MKKNRIFWGVFFILGAIFILAAKLGFLQGMGIWSLIFTVFLAAIFIKSIFSISFFGMFVSLALLAIIYAEPLQIQAVTPWPILGAAVLLGIGFSIIFPRKRFKMYHKKDFGGENVINEQDGSSCNCSVHFGSSIKYINSDNFESANFENNFGGLKVYFDNAIMKGSEAHVYLDNSFGGVELYVPSTWTVVSEIDSAFGGVDKKGKAQPDGLHTLYLHGDNNFGGITILYI